MLAIDLTGKTAFVTGGSGGIGQAITRRFIEAGAMVGIVDLVPPPAEIPGTVFFRTDVSHFEAVGACVAEAIDRFNTIDFLINNAGISRDAPVWKLTEAMWDAVLDVNLKSAFHFAHHLAPHFRARRCGRIVNIASINGMRGKFGLANYAASKAGLIGLTRTLARELGRYNVNVNAIAPGFVNTPLTQKLPAEFRERALAETALQRLVDPEDVANVVLFLCSSLAGNITGSVITVDAGQTA